MFSTRTDVEVASAGTNTGAANPLTSELVQWADLIVVMEKEHRNKVQKRFRKDLKNKRVVCLDIPDEYEFMEPSLVNLLQTRMRRFLPILLPADSG